MKNRLSAAMGAMDVNPQWVEEITEHEARRKWRQQRANAAARGIAFELTFEAWYGWWRATGRYQDRGRHHGEYVMARPGDQGAYVAGNIECVTADRNIRECNQRRVRKKKARL